MQKSLAFLLLLGGCTSTFATQQPGTSATQQLIISESEYKAVSSLSVPPPARLAYVDSSLFTGTKFELGLFDYWLLKSGAGITTDIKSADMIVVPFTGVDSYNTRSVLFGVPEFKLGAFFSTPELAIYGKTTETALNQIAFYIYDAKTGYNILDETSKFGVQDYSVTKTLFVITRESPKLGPHILAR